MNLTLQKPDNVGVLASTLCMLHCVISPFIFIAQSCSTTCCEVTPLWWRWIDYIFLALSFLAIRRSVQVSTNNYIKVGLWLSWAALLIVIINESIELVHLSEIYKYIAALTLVALHLYNQKKCQCKNDKCCTNYE